MEEFSTQAFFYRLTKSIWYIFSFVEFLLFLRFMLFLFGANTSAGFTKLLYGITGPFTNPFSNVFTPIKIERAVIDPNILLALFVYYVVTWTIIRLILMARPIEYHDKSKNNT